MERAQFIEQQRLEAERYWCRQRDVVAIARSDGSFWEALRAFEIERKDEPLPMAPPTPARPHVGSGGWTVYSVPEKRDDSPVDPLFAAFIARVHVPDDVLSARAVIYSLRVAVRADLGFFEDLNY